MIFSRYQLLLFAAVVLICGPVQGVCGYPVNGVSIQGQVFPGKENKRISLSDRKLKSPRTMVNSPVIMLEDIEVMAPQRNARMVDSPRRQIGTARFVDLLSDFQQFRKILEWQKTSDGGFAAILFITSPRAAAVRAGIIVNSLPPTAEFRFFQAVEEVENSALAVITGNQISQRLQRNMDKDPDHPDAQTFWSPTVPGQKMGMEIYLPEGTDSIHLDMAVPFLSHLERLPYFSDGRSMIPQTYGDSDPCQNDVTCYLEWLDVGNAVAKMIFTENGDSYSCTGTLLNDRDDRTWIPYFLTANHCIESQTVASSLETHWFFESAECDSTILSPAYAIRYGGADLLWTRGFAHTETDDNQDVSFLKLNDTPPAGAMFAGWNTVVDDELLTGVHHPAEDWKKISFGMRNGNFACYETMDGYECAPSSMGSFLNIVWVDGGTEPGSSGSGLFNSNGQLVGILLGGAGGNCAGSESDYTRFGAAYSSGNLSQWLDQPNEPVFGTIILTQSFPDITIPTGSDAVVYGTAAPNHIIIGSGAKTELIHFPGQNTIQIQSESENFTVSRSGTVVTFQGPDGTLLKIPATVEVQAISFSDRTWILRIYDNQVITPTYVPITNKTYEYGVKVPPQLKSVR